MMSINYQKDYKTVMYNTLIDNFKDEDKFAGFGAFIDEMVEATEASLKNQYFDPAFVESFTNRCLKDGSEKYIQRRLELYRSGVLPEKANSLAVNS